jgi:hypothetical protein
MVLHLHPLRWEHRLPDWPAAAVAGFAAGAVLMVLELLWTTLVAAAGDPWHISHLVAAILIGPDALQSTGFSVGVVAVALCTHYALGIGFGLVLGWIIVGFHWESNLIVALAVGALFGLALYGLDFHVLAHVFPWMAGLRGWATLGAHLVFGIVAAVMYWKLNRQGVDR